MKIVSWPSTAETHFKALIMLITKVLAAEYITVTSACVLVWLMYTPHVQHTVEGHGAYVVC
jgi:hypothetical protein